MPNNNKLIFLTLISVFFVPLLKFYAQTDNTLATAGNSKISAKEFIERFEFTPHPNQEIEAEPDTAKLNFLKTLIAEKLLAAQAEKEGLDKSPEYLRAFNFMRGFYLRDALYNIEVKNKTAVPDSELAKAYKKIGKSLTVKFIFSQDEKEIYGIFNSLNEGASFDSILTTRPENKEQSDTAKITFGKMNEKMEEEVFKLLPGQYTEPVELKEGWYICRVYSALEKPQLDDNDLRKAQRVVQERMEDKTYAEFYKKFFAGVRVNTDRKLFEKLDNVLYKYIDANAGKFLLTHNKYTLYENEINEIRKNFTPGELSAVFVKFKTAPIRLSAFIDYMGMQGFDFLNKERSRISSRLSAYIADFIRNEIFTREALKRGYDKLPEVAEDIKLWHDNYLSTLLMKGVYKTEKVSDDEAYAFFEKNNRLIPQTDEVKIAEILTDNLDTVKLILDRLNEGASFSGLAAEYTLRDSLKNKGGEFDYQPVDKKGPLWEAAAQMKVGEIFGPIAEPGGYSVIKLLDRKKRKKMMFETFEDAKSSIKDILQTKKMYSALDTLTAKLAVENKIQINENLLNSIKPNPINMLVYRRFGFGGQQTAVPYSPDFSDWYKTYENLKKKTAL